MVSNSGGLAVALDESVLNLSIILPDVKHLSIHDCYEAMVSFVQYMLKDLTNEIEAFEIVVSYCPGDYDLSINNKKFAGISQRRIKDGASIQMYRDVQGNPNGRASHIRILYDVGIKGEEERFTYQTGQAETMASLSELLNVNISVKDMKQLVLTTLKELNDEVLISESFSDYEL